MNVMALGKVLLGALALLAGALIPWYMLGQIEKHISSKAARWTAIILLSIGLSAVMYSHYY